MLLRHHAYAAALLPQAHRGLLLVLPIMHTLMYMQLIQSKEDISPGERQLCYDVLQWGAGRHPLVRRWLAHATAAKAFSPEGAVEALCLLQYMQHGMPEEDIVALWLAAGPGLVRAMTAAVQDARSSAVATAAVAAYTHAALLVWGVTAGRTASDTGMARNFPTPGGLPAAAPPRQAASDAALDWLKAVAALTDAELPFLAAAALKALLPVFDGCLVPGQACTSAQWRLREELAKRLLPRLHSVTRRLGHLHSTGARHGWKLVSALLSYVLDSIPGAGTSTSLRFLHLGDSRGDIPAVHIAAAWVQQCTQIATDPMAPSDTQWSAADSAVRLLQQFGGCSLRQVALETAAVGCGGGRQARAGDGTPPASVRLALRRGVDGCASGTSAAYVCWPGVAPQLSLPLAGALPPLTRLRQSTADALLGCLVPSLTAHTSPVNSTHLSRWRLLLALCSWCSPGVVLVHTPALLRGTASIQQPGDRQPLLQRIAGTWAHVVVWEGVHQQAMRDRTPPYTRSKGGGMLAPPFQDILGEAVQHLWPKSHADVLTQAVLLSPEVAGVMQTAGAPPPSAAAQFQSIFTAAGMLQQGTAPPVAALTGPLLDSLRRPGATSAVGGKPARRFVAEATLALLAAFSSMRPPVLPQEGGGAATLGDARTAAVAVGTKPGPLVPVHTPSAAPSTPGQGGAASDSAPLVSEEEDIFGLASLAASSHTPAAAPSATVDPFALPPLDPPVPPAGAGAAPTQRQRGERDNLRRALAVHVPPAHVWACEVASMLQASLWAVQLAATAAAFASDAAARGPMAAPGGSLGGWLSAILAGDKATQLLSPAVVHPGEDAAVAGGTGAGGGVGGGHATRSSTGSSRRSTDRRSTLFGGGAVLLDTSNPPAPLGQPPYHSLLGQWLDTLGMTLLAARGVMQAAASLAAQATATKAAAGAALRHAVASLQPGSVAADSLLLLRCHVARCAQEVAVGGTAALKDIWLHLASGSSTQAPGQVGAEAWGGLHSCLQEAGAACAAAVGAAWVPWLSAAEDASQQVAAAAAPTWQGTPPSRVLSLALPAAGKWLAASTGGVALLCLGALLPPPTPGADATLKKSAWADTLRTSAQLAAAYASPRDGADTLTAQWSADSAAPLDTLVPKGGASMLHSGEVLTDSSSSKLRGGHTDMGGVNASAVAWLKGTQNRLESALAHAGLSEGPLLSQLRGAALDAVHLWSELAGTAAVPSLQSASSVLAVAAAGGHKGTLHLPGSLLSVSSAAHGLPLPGCPTPSHLAAFFSAMGALQQLVEAFRVPLAPVFAGLTRDMGLGIHVIPDTDKGTSGAPSRASLASGRLHKPHGKVFGRQHGAASSRPAVQDAPLPPRPVPHVSELCSLLCALSVCDPLVAGPVILRGLGPLAALVAAAPLSRVPSLVNVQRHDHSQRLCDTLLQCLGNVLRATGGAQGKGQLAAATVAIKAVRSASVPACMAERYCAMLTAELETLSAPAATNQVQPEHILFSAKSGSFKGRDTQPPHLVLSGSCDAFAVRGKLVVQPQQEQGVGTDKSWAQAALAAYGRLAAPKGTWGYLLGPPPTPNMPSAAAPLQLHLTVRNMMPSTVAGLQVRVALGGGLHPAGVAKLKRCRPAGIAPLNPLPMGNGASAAALLGWSPPSVTLQSAGSAAAHRLPLYSSAAGMYGWGSSSTGPGAGAGGVLDTSASVGRAVPSAGHVELAFDIEVHGYQHCSVSAHVTLSNVDVGGDSRLTLVSLQQGGAGRGDADSITSNDPAVEGSYGRGGWASTMHVQGGHLAGDSSGASWLESVVSAPGGDEGGLPALMGSDSLVVAGGGRWAAQQQESGSSYSISDVLAPPSAGGGEGDTWALAAHAAEAYAGVAAAAMQATAESVAAVRPRAVVGPRAALAAAVMDRTAVALQCTTLPPAAGASASSTPRTPVVANSRRRSFFSRGSPAPGSAGAGTGAAPPSTAHQAWAPLHEAALGALRGLLMVTARQSTSMHPKHPRSRGSARPPLAVGAGGAVDNAFHMAWSSLVGALGVALPPPGSAGLIWVGPSLVKGGAVLSGFGVTDSPLAQQVLEGRVTPKSGGGFFRSTDPRHSGWIIARGVALGGGEDWNPHSIAAGGGLMAVEAPSSPLAAGLFLAYKRGAGLPRGISFAKQQVTGIATGQLTAARGGVSSTGGGGRRMTSTGSGVHVTGGRRGSQMTGGSGSVRRSVGGQSGGGVDSVVAGSSVGGDGASSRDAASEAALAGALAAGSGAVVRRLTQRGALCTVPLQYLVFGCVPHWAPWGSPAAGFDAVWSAMTKGGHGGIETTKHGISAGPSAWAVPFKPCVQRSVSLGGPGGVLDALLGALTPLCGQSASEHVARSLHQEQHSGVSLSEACDSLPLGGQEAQHANLQCVFVAAAAPGSPGQGVRVGCCGVGCTGEPVLAQLCAQQEQGQCTVLVRLASPSASLAAAVLSAVLAHATAQG